jgi:cytochrome c oxidase cbb3-type subunit IV
MPMLQSAITVLLFVTFVGICLWAWSGRRKKAFEEAANLPFADEEPSSKQDGVAR